MTYRIYETTGPYRHLVATVATIEAARTFLAGWGELVDFDPDPEHDAADAVLKRKRGALELYVIEKGTLT